MPSSRSNYAALTPGASRSTDVGGSNGSDAGATFTIHGTRGGDTRAADRRHALELDGGRQRRHRVLLRPDRRRGDRHSAGRQLGGVRAWRRAGEPGSEVRAANRFNGYGFAGYTNNSLNSTSIPDELKARGLPSIGAVDYIYDYSGSLGGPIIQDKLWFFYRAAVVGQLDVRAWPLLQQGHRRRGSTSPI